MTTSHQRSISKIRKLVEVLILVIELFIFAQKFNSISLPNSIKSGHKYFAYMIQNIGEI
jgi:hypothetical protein